MCYKSQLDLAIGYSHRCVVYCENRVRSPIVDYLLINNDGFQISMQRENVSTFG